MKGFFIKDIKNIKEGKTFSLYCWIKSVRHHGKILFYELVDSTGTTQAMIKHSDFSSDEFKRFVSLKEETAILFKGIIKNKEIVCKDIEVIAECKIDFSPKVRSDFGIFEDKYTNHILKNKDYYLRNSMINAALNFKSKYVFQLHKYFQDKGYTLIEAPVLTEKLLYDDSSAFSFNYLGRPIWLSQCCTFQLEPAICSFEKVYNITPSFRAEHSRSDRHLNEYIHLKVELAWAKLNDLISIAEDLLYSVSKNMVSEGKGELSVLKHKIDLSCLKPPYKRVTYDECVKILNKNDFKFQWGKSLSKSDESFLTKHFGNKPIWIQYIPRSAEGFPFKICDFDDKLTMVADLIAPNGFGEILGVAEKISDKNELIKRMKEKNKYSKEQIERYSDYLSLRDSGLPFHGGIGMGVDRVARFLMGLPHVKDVLPYPRLFGRRWNP